MTSNYIYHPSCLSWRGTMWEGLFYAHFPNVPSLMIFRLSVSTLNVSSSIIWPQNCRSSTIIIFVFSSGTGSLDGETSGACTNNTIKVKIVDAWVFNLGWLSWTVNLNGLRCPATHPANYCKTSRFGGSIPDTGACTAAGTNAFDLATPVKAMLSTYAGEWDRLDLRDDEDVDWCFWKSDG